MLFKKEGKGEREKQEEIWLSSQLSFKCTQIQPSDLVFPLIGLVNLPRIKYLPVQITVGNAEGGGH